MLKRTFKRFNYKFPVLFIGVLGFGFEFIFEVLDFGISDEVDVVILNI